MVNGLTIKDDKPSSNNIFADGQFFLENFENKRPISSNKRICKIREIF